MRQSLDSAKEEAAAKLKELEDLHRQLEAANSDALAAKEAAAGLNIDLANALDRLASQTAIAASAKEAAEARETALKEELKGLKSRHAEQVGLCSCLHVCDFREYEQAGQLQHPLQKLQRGSCQREDSLPDSLSLFLRHTEAVFAACCRCTFSNKRSSSWISICPMLLAAMPVRERQK